MENNYPNVVLYEEVIQPTKGWAGFTTLKLNINQRRIFEIYYSIEEIQRNPYLGAMVSVFLEGLLKDFPGIKIQYNREYVLLFDVIAKF